MTIEVAGVILNPKCAVISMIAVGLYWVCPTRHQAGRWATTAGLAVATYVSIAHYDEYYSCNRHRLKARGGIYSKTIGLLKPPVHPIKETYGSSMEMN